ncbi:MAG TPA: hypothetical protein VJR05_10515, partial [Acidimicrobiia bacterium]|nr:hypothetical protein [Acidimicrobiia bacterium]
GAGLVLTAVNLAAFRRGGDDDPIFRNGTIVYEANGNIRMVDPDGSNDRRVIGDFNDNIWHTCPRYSPDGRSLAYFEDGRLRLTQVDPSGRPVGSAIRSGAAVDRFFSCGVRSPDGQQLAVHSWDESGGWRLTLFSLTDGSQVPVADGLTSDVSVWGPEGTWVAYPVATGIAIYDTADGAADLIQTKAPPAGLAVSPEGNTFAYVAEFDDGSSHVFLVDRHTGVEDQLTAGDARRIAPAWSPRSGILAYIETCGPRPDPQCTTHIAIDNGGQKTVLPPVEPDGIDAIPRGPLLWSPDGQWILYVAIERSSPDGLTTGAPVVAAPLIGAPRVLTTEFGVGSTDWQPLPAG